MILALLIVVFTWLSFGSGLRLGAVGAVGLVVAFLAMPFVDVVGARSDQGTALTPFGLAFTYPVLWLVPVLAIVAAIVSLRATPRVGGAAFAVAGAVALALGLTFRSGPEHFITLRAIPGVLEVILPLALGVVTYLLTAGQKGAARRNGLIATIALPALLAALLFSPLGANLFPQLRNYYQVSAPITSAQAQTVTNDWSLDVKDFLQADVQKRAEDWRATRELLARPAAGTDRAKQNKDYYDLVDEYALRRRAPGDTTPLPATVATPDEVPYGFPPGPEASDGGVRRVIARGAEYGFNTWMLFSGLALGGGLILVTRGGGLTYTPRRDLTSALTLSLLAAAVAAGFNSTGFNFRDLYVNWPWIADFMGRATPPDPYFLSDVMREMVITINIALIGTLVAAVFALPLSLLAARNLTEKSLLTRVAYFITRTFFNVDRGVDTLILALILVAAVGLGPFAGALAMAVHSIADLGKLYSEAIENADKGPIEALEASGAPGTSVVRWALLPQVLPLFLSYTLYRFEINFRVSIVLGFVGAGGIGFLVSETMRGGQYPKAMIAIIVIVVVVNVLDFLSAAVRRRLV
ncbi:phosphonate ABC transporter, permease protein PhnE [Deinococcus pimensis]|uniref:phosphonate ABC transporter, permease protein PhnE n=1 Tax=Deinococcus pimensis TaxID=309888 RepID=UPI001B7FD46A|nr:phosphonate ABC transporter, permease protein PhnE [Deinococcus pimensis]